MAEGDQGKPRSGGHTSVNVFMNGIKITNGTKITRVFSIAP
jgi:hypothetical protein